MKKLVFYIFLAMVVSALWVGLAFADDGTMTLGEGVAWLLTGGGAGVFTYILIDKVPYFKKQPPDYKRYWSIGMVVVITILGWGFGMLMNYMPTPAHWREGVEMAFSVMFVSLTSSLLLHGGIDLRKKRLNDS